MTFALGSCFRKGRAGFVGFVLISLYTSAHFVGPLGVVRADPSETPRLQGPRIQVEERSARVGANAPYYTFEFRNVGDEDLIVLRTNSSCSCHYEQLSDAVIAPDGMGKLKLFLVDSNGYLRDKIYVEITTNDPIEPRVIFTLEEIDRRPIVVSPAEIRLGEVKNTDLVEAEFYIILQEEARNSILSVECQSPLLTIGRLSQSMEEGTERVRYRLFGSLETTAGSFLSAILIRTSHPSMPLVEIPIRAEVKSPINSTPRQVLFGQVRVGTEVRQNVMITKPEMGTEIARVECSDPRVITHLSEGTSADEMVLEIILVAGERIARCDTYVKLYDVDGMFLDAVRVYASLVP